MVQKVIKILHENFPFATCLTVSQHLDQDWITHLLIDSPRLFVGYLRGINSQCIHLFEKIRYQIKGQVFLFQRCEGWWEFCRKNCLSQWTLRHIAMYLTLLQRLDEDWISHLLIDSLRLFVGCLRVINCQCIHPFEKK